MKDEENKEVLEDSAKKEKPKTKKLRGFANPELRKNINRAGRAEGTKNRKTKLSHKEISDMFSSHTPEVFRHAMKLMKTGSEATQRAMVAKFLDHTISLSMANEKMRIEKKDKDGKVTGTYEVEQPENKETGTGQVLKLNWDK